MVEEVDVREFCGLGPALTESRALWSGLALATNTSEEQYKRSNGATTIQCKDLIYTHSEISYLLVYYTVY
jgi:hypothetical protein